MKLSAINKKGRNLTGAAFFIAVRGSGGVGGNYPPEPPSRRGFPPLPDLPESISAKVNGSEAREAFGQQGKEAVGINPAHEHRVGFAGGDTPPVGHSHAESEF